MTEPKEYCTIDPPFPMKGYLVSLLILKSDGTKAIFPLEHIFHTLDNIASEIGKIKQQESEETGTYDVSDVCFIVPISFSRRYELRREFWQNPDNTYSTDQRVFSFVRSMNKPDLFSLLVTPSRPDEVWQFMAAIPLPNTASDKVIEQFMLHSDWPVEETAKYAAIYRLEKLQVYNWIEKQVVVKPHIHPFEEFVN